MSTTAAPSNEFLERILRTGQERGLKTDNFRRRFEELQNKGVEPKLLAAYLELITFAILYQKKVSWAEFLELPEENVLKNLPNDMEHIADQIEMLSRCKGSKLISPDALLPQVARPVERAQGRAMLYQQLPQILRCYAYDLRSISTWVQRLFGPKRFNLHSFLSVKLLEIVKQRTGSPHYEAVADLLSTCFAVDNTEGPQGLQSPEGLAKVYARYSRRGFIRPALPEPPSRK